MTLEELKELDWYKEKPQVIKDAVDLLPPIHLYKFKETGKQCWVFSYEEPNSSKVDDVTVTVQKTGIGGYLDPVLAAVIDTNQVFGVGLNDLEVWVD